MEKKIKAVKIVFISVIVIIAVLVTLLLIMSEKLKTLQDEIKTLTTYAMAVPEYEFYDKETEYVTLEDAYLGEISLKALEGVAKNSYDYENLEYEKGRFSYVVDGIKTSATGIDISYFHENIDFQKVKADGIDFVMIRVGYRGYAEGIIKEDTRFEEYINAAIEAELDVGVYFYSQAVNVAEALEEAEFVLDKIKPYELTYPVAYDIEITEAENVRANGISGSVLNDIAEVFCDRIAEDGYRPMVYANKRMAYLKLDMSRICKYDFWVADWSNFAPPSFAYDFRIWQYDTEGEVDGINFPVDMNNCFYNYRL
jgi:GH25 family lysozyme M1 (1,4-beta-N-acetylmuramidase)